MRVGQKKRYPRLDWGVRKGLPWQWGPSCMGLGLLWWWIGLLCFGPYVGFHRGKQAWQAQVFICRTFFDGSCKLGSFIRALLGHPCGPMRRSLGLINVAHLTTQYMDVTSLLAWNMESFPRKLVVQSLFFHTGSVIWGDFVCSAR